MCAAYPNRVIQSNNATRSSNLLNLLKLLDKTTQLPKSSPGRSKGSASECKSTVETYGKTYSEQ